ncbi:hypothetical protein [Escherichia coli]|uniref:hypothetical protein n=1 Tax=Escherichia coli TaxID=562 RepID=UPI0035B65D9A
MAASDAFVVAVDAKWLLIVVTLPAFVSDRFATLSTGGTTALLEGSAAAALLILPVAFADAVPALEDAD